MNEIHFATTNSEKFLIAQTICSEARIRVIQVKLDIDEIQGEEPKLIIEDKAKRAYSLIKKPLVVSDDTWDIPALKGFPGPYMKSINKWFSPEDFIRLMAGVKDRRIILHQSLLYIDKRQLKFFTEDITGQIIDSPRGLNERSPNTTVTMLDLDNGKTIAEVFEQGEPALTERYKTRHDAWHAFCDWYQNQ